MFVIGFINVLIIVNGKSIVLVIKVGCMRFNFGVNFIILV